MTDNHFDNHQRVHNSLTGKLERRILRGLCARMPGWMTPDILTLIGLFAGILIAASYALTGFSKNFLWLASLGLVLHWFGDSLDGTLARYRKMERPRYGFFIDHSLDTLTAVLVGLGIGFSPFVRLDYVLFAVIAYLVMCVSASTTVCVTGIYQISYGRLGPTELRAALIAANTVLFFFENPVVGHLRGPLTVCDLIALVIAIFLALAFIGTTLRTAAQLRRRDASLKT